MCILLWLHQILINTEFVLFPIVLIFQDWMTDNASVYEIPQDAMSFSKRFWQIHVHYNIITSTETEITVRISHECVHVGQLTVFYLKLRYKDVHYCLTR